MVKKCLFFNGLTVVIYLFLYYYYYLNFRVVKKDL